jgi:SAM-dependent methyltransferase
MVPRCDRLPTTGGCVDQDRVFADFEANNWFRRNRPSLAQFAPASDLPLRLVELAGLRPRAALEVGAANGVRLAALHDRYETKVMAVEPSDEAIQDGRARFPCVEFRKGLAHDVPVDGEFDLVIVNFVLHWVDRRQLYRTIKELDRLVADGGFLLIGDFDPTNYVRVRYHHLPKQEIFTYKQDYASLFISSGLYHRIAFIAGMHGRTAGDEPDRNQEENERIGAWLLRKRLQEYYYQVGPVEKTVR